MKLFVGNIPFAMSEEQLRETFEEYGVVVSCKLVMDRDTGRSKGFGFVEYASKEEAQSAIDSLNQAEVMGKALVVNEARPQEKKSFGAKRPQQRRRY